MAAVQFKRYTPGASQYSRRRTEEEWNAHKDLLIRLHKQHYTRRQMLGQLRGEGFDVTSGQLLAQMKKWNLTVYGNQSTEQSTIQDVTTVSGMTTEDLSNPCGLETNDERSDVIDIGIIGGLHVANPDCEEDSGLGIGLDLHHDELSMPLVSSIISIKSDDSVEEASHDRSGQFGSTDSLLISDDVIPHSFDEEIGRESSRAAAQDSEDVPTTVPTSIEWRFTSAKSIRAQLPIILDSWCEQFPMSCCCNSLMFIKGSFQTSSAIYRTMLDQADPYSLQHVWALLCLVDLKQINASDSVLYAIFRSTLERYLKLCTRTEHKNKQANLILHHLLKVWSMLDDCSLISTGPPNSYTTIRKMFRLRIPTDSAQRLRYTKSRWESISERDLGIVAGFTARKPSLFPLINWSGTLFGSTQSWTTVQGQDDAAQLLETAHCLSQYMQETWEKQAKEHAFANLGKCDLPAVFNALGLMIGLELDDYARSLIFKNRIARAIDDWPTELKSFIDTTITTLSLNSEYADKFRKCYWLGRFEKIGIDGKGIHLGPCSCMYHWQVFSRDIHAYDEPRTWIERTLFSTPSSWPTAEDLLGNDTASVRSTSSLGSFRRFQALALQLKLGTPLSGSMRSKSSKGKTSLDSHMSWQLETMLQIKEDTTIAEENEIDYIEKIDQEAYELMRNVSEDRIEDRDGSQNCKQ